MRQLHHLLTFTSLIIMAGICMGATELSNGLALEKSKEARVLRDTAATMTLDQARASNHWKTIESRQDIYPGYDHSAFWLTLPIKNSASAEPWVLSLQSTGWEEIDWYILRANGEIESSSGGTTREGRPGTMPGPKPNITLNLTPGEEVQLYLRCRSEARASLSLRAEKLSNYDEGPIYAIYLLSFGAIGTLCLFGLIIGFYAKQKGAIAYAVSAASITLIYLGLSNFAQVIGLPFSHFLSTKGIIFFSELSLLTALFYLRSFFDLGRLRRWPDITWWFLLITCIISLPLSLLLPFHPFIRWLNVHSMVFSFATFSIAIWAWRQGMTYARFYVYSWPFILFALIFDSLAREGLLPASIPEAQGHIVVLGILIFQLGVFIAFAELIRTKIREHKKIQTRILEAERDLNERLENEVHNRTASLKIATDQALKANHFKDIFLANVSHEIRTPLSALIGLSQVMVRKGEERGLPEDFRRLLGQIHSGGSHLNLMLTNLMDVSTSSQGRIPLKISDIDINAWSQSVRDIIEPLAIARGLPPIHWNLDLEGSNTFRSDPVRLSQILINLVHNALKFSPIDGTVIVQMTLVEENLTLEVLDNGCGIPDDPTVLFKVFERNEAAISDTEHGAGLGLYIVQTSLDLLRGKISARNRPEGGAAFHVIIPQDAIPQDTLF